MSLCDINPFVDSRWDTFLKTTRAATVFHTTEWMSVIRDTYGYECRVLATQGPDRVLTSGLPYCVVDSYVTGKRLVSLPFSDYCAPLGDRSSDAARIVIGMKQIAAVTQSRRVDIRGCDGIDASGSLGLVPIERFLRHTIDLCGGIRIVEQRFHKDCVRRRVRKAVRAGIDSISGTESLLVDDFYELLVLTRRRHGYPPPPKAWFKNVAKAMPGVEFSVAYREGVPIAAIVTLRLHNVVYYKYGASDVRCHHWGAMPLLYSEMIGKAINAGAEYVDLGRTEPSNKGLVDFKERFGAVASCVQYWRFGSEPRKESRMSRWIDKTGRFICARTPLVLLPRIGTLLYPHVG